MASILDIMLARFVALLETVARLRRSQKQLIVLAADSALLVVAIWIAYSLRLDTWQFWNEAIRKIGLGAFALFIPSFIFAGVYNTIFRYTGTGSMRTLARAFTYFTVAMVAVYLLWGFRGVPRTMGILVPLCFFVLVTGSRVAARSLFVDLLGRQRYGGVVRRVLVYGAGNAGQQLVSSMNSAPEMNIRGYLDDDKRLDGQKLNGQPVFWTGNLEAALQKTEATDILLALPSISRKRRRQIVRGLEGYKVNVKTLPQIKDLVDGRVSFSDIRPLEVEDLLGREPVTPNELLLGKTITGKNVLVTGAGGSIGSELCRQIAHMGAAKLVLFEMSEFSLYAIDKELRTDESTWRTKIVSVLGSVTDRERLSDVFHAHTIDTVYHAAAYKHVPLVEENPVEGIRNNVLGTYEVAKAASEAKVSDFILISTDKAVRPTNVMGATKRCAEQIVQAFAEKSKGANFSMVRFGNVLGSSGSVVPLFRTQIEGGGPVTITHKDVTRYFMTIPEAANLVIQAAGLARGGGVFVLDMGKPVKIYDLARTMVQLSGLTVRSEAQPDGDIEIAEVGLRPGEKLFEELLIGESPEKTMHPRIMMAQENFMPWDELVVLLEQIRKNRVPQAVVDLLGKMVPEFDHRRDNDKSGQAV